MTCDTCYMVGLWVPSSHADTHLLSDRGDTCSTSATWLYIQPDLEEKVE